MVPLHVSPHGPHRVVVYNYRADGRTQDQAAGKAPGPGESSSQLAPDVF